MRGMPGPDRIAAGAVDCDVHDEIPAVTALYPYLPEQWVEHLEQTQFKGPTDEYYPKRTLHRQDVTVAAPDADTVGAYVFDGSGATVAVLNCTYGVDSLHNPDQAVALARAVNDWQIGEWLSRDSRFRASIVIPIQIPDLAIEEIERVADHPGFVQVLLPVRSAHPYGSRVYHRLWETIARRNLVGGIHFGGAPGNPPTPVGWPSYYFEDYVAAACTFASQVSSIICEGVFDRIPDLRVALLESGFTWLPAHMWRLDKEWRELRRVVPWVRRPPSDYIREHIHISVLPLDAPSDAAQLMQVVEQLECEELLMYASDYPHRHAQDPERDLLAQLPTGVAEKVRSANARAWYGISERE